MIKYPSEETKELLQNEADKLLEYSLDKTLSPYYNKGPWEYFMKRQVPWYGLIELNQLKIIEMRDWVQNYTYLTKRSIKRQVRQMTEVINLGYKILADEYNKDSYKWLRENTVSVTLIYKGNLKDKNLVAKLYNTDIFDDIAEKFNFDEYRLSDEAKQQLANYVKDKDTRKLKEWLKDNNLTRNQVITAYTSEYTNGLSEEENQAMYHEMMIQDYKTRQKDMKKYFSLIAKYYDNWGD